MRSDLKLSSLKKFLSIGFYSPLTEYPATLSRHGGFVAPATCCGGLSSLACKIIFLGFRGICYWTFGDALDKNYFFLG